MTTHKACKHCAQLLPSDAQFCPNCGATTSDSTPRACPRCGQSNPGTARFCQQCGTSLLEPAAPPSGGGASQTAPQAKPAWGQVALGGLGGLLLGQLFGGRGGFGGYGDNDDFGGGGGDGG
jgi:RNA polymerase subunit RPABC4/transcription elongation factor Spt4